MRWRGSALGRRWGPPAAEALLVVGVYSAYSTVRVLVEGTVSDAVENAFRIVAIESAMGIFHELALQRWFDAVPGLLLAMEGAYRFLYMPAIVLGSIAIYLRDRALYRRYRSAFFLSLGIGLIFFTLLPVAPPRMLPEFGFVDTIHGVGVATSDGGRNNFAAVPSFHFGFPLLTAIAFAHVYRLRPWQCALLALFPATMLLAIVSTANHFFLDALIGAAVVLGSAWWFVWRPAEDERVMRRSEALGVQAH